MKRVVCVGGAVVDRKYVLRSGIVLGTSNPASSSVSAGGVARNVAENLARLGVPSSLVARVGDDAAGADLLRHTASAGVDVSAVVAAGSTAEYVAVLDPHGELVLGVAAMEVLEGLSVADVTAAWPSGGWVFADCNPPARVLAAAVARARETGVPLAVDAVSTPKAVKLPRDLTGVAVLFCNGDEARALAGAHLSDDDAAADLHRAGAGAVVLTRGSGGVLLADDDGIRSLAAHPAAVVDVTGAGDALVAGTLAGLVAGEHLDRAAAEGVRLAAWTVESPHTVRPETPPWKEIR